jgi:phage terminase small subunit
MSDKLTNKQRAFVAEYMKDLNGTQAAIRAGYSPKTACSIASENLRKPHIKRAIEDAMSAAEMNPQEVALRLAMQARGTMADFLDFEGYGQAAFDLRKAAERGVLGLVKSIKYDGKTGMLTEVELYDAQGALKQLARIHAMMEQRINVKHSWEDQLEREGIDPNDAFEQLIQSIAGSEVTITSRDS